jgi:hypothetical protein
MRSRKFEIPVGVIYTLLIISIGAQAQDFQRSYLIAAGGRIRVRNISGDIKVLGYNGNSILVNGRKEGPDAAKIEIEDASKGDLLELGVRYPEKTRNFQGSVNFEIRVPQSLPYAFENISSVSGDVELTGVTGKIKAESVSGDVTVQDFIGGVDAHSVSGDVKAEIRRLQGTDDMKLSSISGDVHAKAPADLDADVKMSSVSGSVKSDFPLQIHERRYGAGQSAGGILGGGSHTLRLTSISGDVILNHIQK